KVTAPEARSTWARRSLHRAATETPPEMELLCRAIPDRPSACRTQMEEEQSRCHRKARRRAASEAAEEEMASAAATALGADSQAKAQAREEMARAAAQTPTREAESLRIRGQAAPAAERAVRPLCPESRSKAEPPASRCRALDRRMATRRTGRDDRRLIRTRDSKQLLKRARARAECLAPDTMDFSRARIIPSTSRRRLGWR